MDEKLYTIPLTEAFEADDECPFCFVERKIENELLDFVLGSGSTYMESDVRAQTDAEGFCRIHFKKMFDYGNTLGNAWIMKTHLETVHRQFSRQTKMYSPSKTPFMAKLRGGNTQSENAVSAWVKEKDHSCYICKRFDETYRRYLDTFFYLYKKDSSMQEKIRAGKGFCLTHFGELCELAESNLNTRQKEEFYPLLFSAMERALTRLQEDADWLVEKFDYRNQDADWKTSKDALQRCMQKLHGGYPADAPYKKQ